MSGCTPFNNPAYHHTLFHNGYVVKKVSPAPDGQRFLFKFNVMRGIKSSIQNNQDQQGVLGRDQKGR